MLLCQKSLKKSKFKLKEDKRKKELGKRRATVDRNFPETDNKFLRLKVVNSFRSKATSLTGLLIRLCYLMKFQKITLGLKSVKKTAKKN